MFGQPNLTVGYDAHYLYAKTGQFTMGVPSPSAMVNNKNKRTVNSNPKFTQIYKNLDKNAAIRQNKAKKNLSVYLH